jgi:hypothetical protein
VGLIMFRACRTQRSLEHPLRKSSTSGFLLSLTTNLCFCVGGALGQQVIGTYTLSTPATLAGGCPPVYVNPYYSCQIAPYAFTTQLGKPLLIPAVPGTYTYSVVGGSLLTNGVPCNTWCQPNTVDNPAIWSGDAVTGYLAATPFPVIGAYGTFVHGGGYIVLYLDVQAAVPFPGCSPYCIFTGSAVLTLSGPPPTMPVLFCPAADATVHASYTSALAATGGVLPYTSFGIISGALPPGLPSVPT